MRGGRRRTVQRSIGAVVAFVAIASACNSRLIRPPAIVHADAGEYVIGTTVNEQSRRFPSVFHAFLPSRVPLHPGDAVNFDLQDTGEPHAVALGRLVDAASAAIDTLGPTATVAKVEEHAAMRKIPSVLPRTVTDDVPELNRAATERCFLSEGAPDVSAEGRPCPEGEQPDFDGTQTFYSSGLLEEGEPFRMKLSPDIAPGNYRFMCLNHRAAMTGTVEVVPKDTDRPTVAVLKQDGIREEESIASALEPSAKTAASREGGAIAAGTGPVGITRGFISAFIPNVAEAKVGEPVRWDFYRTHSISFRPTRDAKEGLLLDEEDPVRINPDAWKPVGSKPVPKEVFTYPPKAKSFQIDGGTWSGEDTFSSGVIRSTPPIPVSYTMRFSAPGEYAYQCLVHQSMRGTVHVE